MTKETIVVKYVQGEDPHWKATLLNPGLTNAREFTQLINLPIHSRNSDIITQVLQLYDTTFKPLPWVKQPTPDVVIAPRPTLTPEEIKCIPDLLTLAELLDAGAIAMGHWYTPKWHEKDGDVICWSPYLPHQFGSLGHSYTTVPDMTPVFAWDNQYILINCQANADWLPYVSSTRARVRGSWWIARRPLRVQFKSPHLVKTVLAKVLEPHNPQDAVSKCQQIADTHQNFRMGEFILDGVAEDGLPIHRYVVSVDVNGKCNIKGSMAIGPVDVSLIGTSVDFEDALRAAGFWLLSPAQQATIVNKSTWRVLTDELVNNAPKPRHRLHEIRVLGEEGVTDADIGAWKAQIYLDPKALQMIFEDIAHAHEGF